MAHPSVSRSHALLVVDKDLGAFLVDLGASNGSFVDGRVRLYFVSTFACVVMLFALVSCTVKMGYGGWVTHSSSVVAVPIIFSPSEDTCRPWQQLDC